MPRRAGTDLLKILERYKAKGISVKRSQLYHSWGGKITPDDLKGLEIDVMDSASIYKNGACSLLFTGIQIMATGLVHACACIDVNASLQIGDLNKQPLSEILSSKKPAVHGPDRGAAAGRVSRGVPRLRILPQHLSPTFAGSEGINSDAIHCRVQSIFGYQGRSSRIIGLGDHLPQRRDF